MIGVVCFPVNEFRILHDVFAIIFFVGNAFMLAKHSFVKLNENVIV